MATPRRILLMSHQLDIGGSERQMTEIAKRLDRSRFEPHVGCFHSEGMRAEELRDAGVPILRLPVTSFRSLSAVGGARMLIRYIRRNRIDLVHTFDVPLNVFGVPAARLARLPFVVSSQRAHRGLTPGVYHWLLRVTDRLVDRIVVNCEHMRHHLQDEDGVAPELIRLCYNGIDTANFKPRERPAGPLTIGVLCALRPEKGLPTLLEAFANIHRAHSGVKLVIAGGGPCLPELQAQARELGIADLCEFTGSTSAVAERLNQFDIFVLPSRSEALSNAVMEAMACGCCVVASRVGGNPELVGAGEERGLLFESGNAVQLAAALERLIGDPALRRRLAASGCEFIHAGFSIQQSARRMGEIYEELFTGDSGRSLQFATPKR